MSTLFSVFTSTNIRRLIAMLFLVLGAQVYAFEPSESIVERQIPFSFKINYKGASSKLCWIGAKYDTDKSSQRRNVTDARHCHPYTLFYHSIFRNQRNSNLVIAELGILYGSSLLMWRDYFPNSTIHGFEYNPDLIGSFERSYGNDRIHLFPMDVKNEMSIMNAIQSTGMLYDLIIDDTTHEFEDQLRIIQNVHASLKPGGMLIIEDIFKSYNEQDYIERLKPILHEFQDYYFVTMDHKNRRSTGWNNDKLFVLVKGGADPIFKNRKKITIITPSIRPENLHKIKDSIDFNYVDEWIIVYDGKKIPENPHLFVNEGNEKIKEYIHSSEGASGNPQRNFALDHVQNKDTYLYFLDDDNLIHKDLYKLLDIIDDGKIYTFDQEARINGNIIKKDCIDTAMFLIDFKLCRNIRWRLHPYTADFFYIDQCYLNNRDKWVYVKNVLCKHNALAE